MKHLLISISFAYFLIALIAEPGPRVYYTSAPGPSSARVIQDPAGLAVAWDFADADLTVKATVTNIDGTTTEYVGTVTHFQARFNNGTPTNVGLVVHATIPGGKTYRTPVPSTITGSFTVDISACATYTTPPNTPPGCGNAASGSFTTQSPKFSVGQRVQVYSGTEFGEGAAVRSSPSMTAPIDQVYPAGTKGTVLQGPTLADNFNWYRIDYEGTGADGWTTETNLEICPSPCTGDTPNVPPTTSITSPASGATFTAPAAIAVTATAADSDGTVKFVELFQGSAKVGEDATAPYEFTIPNVPAGTFVLTVAATDDKGAVTPSDPVSVTVTTPPTPTVPLAPYANACRWTLQAEPPDSSLGWRAQFRQNGVPVGSRDNTAPYDRTFNVGAGSFKFDIEWTKANSTNKVLSDAATLVCPGK